MNKYLFYIEHDSMMLQNNVHQNKLYDSKLYILLSYIVCTNGKGIIV